jgi:hypothetical protein
MFVFLIFISLPCNLVMRNKDYIINKLSRQKGQQEEHNGYTKQKNKHSDNPCSHTTHGARLGDPEWLILYFPLMVPFVKFILPKYVEEISYLDHMGDLPTTI